MTEAFDFVIVGAGSSGCVVADKLSQCGRYSVLLLEAGGSDGRWETTIPAGYARTFLNADVNWMDTTQPEPNMGGRSIYLPAGKVLGGSSSINAMLYVRGAAADYDAWETAGNGGWGAPHAERCFRNIESSTIGDDALRGRKGKLKISLARELPVSKAFYGGLAELGVPANADYNGRTQEGFGPNQFTVANGRRSSASRSFLNRARRRSNLSIRVQARVTRVLLSNRRASGVEFEQGGKLRNVVARREVILSAGAIRSPQLLQLSGIGPTELLRKHGIEVRYDAGQVGRQLQDHVSCTFAFKSKEPTLNTALNSVFGKVSALGAYVFARKGPIATSLFTSGAFVRSAAALQQPDLQLYFIPASFTGIGRPPGSRFQLDAMPAFTLMVCPLNPTSRGEVRISSADPRDAPVIQPNYLSTPHDLATIVRGVRYIQTLIRTAPMRALIDAPLLPLPSTDDDQCIVAHVQASAISVFHPVGTCRMGPDPASAVVDARLKVYGFEGLRVVDASVMPTITSGNTNAPAMMIGERGAEFILDDLAAAERRA